MKKSKETHTGKNLITERLERAERNLQKAERYLETGKGGRDHCFGPLLCSDDRLPHPDWVRNVFIPVQKLIIHRCKQAQKSLADKARERAKRPFR
jgi:hypothetical protein